MTAALNSGAIATATRTQAFKITTTSWTETNKAVRPGIRLAPHTGLHFSRYVAPSNTTCSLPRPHHPNK